MSIVIFQHAPSDGLGRLAPVLRDHGHRLDIRRLDLAPAAGGRSIPPDLDGVSAVISLGGPQNVGEDHPWMRAELDFLRAAHERQLPVIGICLGAQMIAAALGGEVGPMPTPEFGFCRVTQTPAGNTDVMLAGIPWGTHQFQAHAQEIRKLPPDSALLASSPGCKVQCFRAGLRTYGFQYHFESLRDDIDGFARDAWGRSVMQALGLSETDLKSQCEQHFDTFARLGDRLCGNLVGLMFPAVTRTRA